MIGNLTLYVDQYGNKWFAHSVKELRGGSHWCTAFQPIERAA